jgi:hypothetical protein
MPAATPQSEQDAITQIANMLAKNNPALTNFYAASEIELKLGAVYEQQNGEAGVLTDVTDYGLIATNWGIGATAIEQTGGTASTSGTKAAFVHVNYRKVIGNVAASAGMGMGYDIENSTPMGVVQGDVEYRWTTNLGSYGGLGYAIENSGEKRGMIVGAGMSYAF